MTERAVVNTTMQMGLETVPGTGVAAGKSLNAFSITPAVKFDITRFRALGNKYASVGVPGRQWVEAKIAGVGTYGELIYLLSSVLVKVSPGTDGTTKTWTLTPALSAPDTVATYTVEQGSSVRAHKFEYGLVTELGLKFSRQAGVEIDGSMLGEALQDGITMTGTPSAVESTPLPIAGDDISVYLADSWAGLAGASASTRVLTAEWRVANRFNTLWVLDASQTSFVAVVETAPTVSLKLKMEADSAGMALLTTMGAGTTKWARIKCTGAAIETGKYYTLQIDGAYVLGEPSEFSDEDGVYAIEWNAEAIYDATAGKTIEAYMRNQVASL
jgi:hypothetical protein